MERAKCLIKWAARKPLPVSPGSSNIEPDDLQEVMAISSDNSIFVAAALLSDPHAVVASRDLRYIVGNVGFSGLNLMVAPVDD
jgi:hypothetical protein